MHWVRTQARCESRSRRRSRCRHPFARARLRIPRRPRERATLDAMPRCPSPTSLRVVDATALMISSWTNGLCSRRFNHAAGGAIVLIDVIKKGRRPQLKRPCELMIVPNRGSRPARSSSETSVRCRLHAWPRASCERPARAARRAGSTRIASRGPPLQCSTPADKTSTDKTLRRGWSRVIVCVCPETGPAPEGLDDATDREHCVRTRPPRHRTAVSRPNSKTLAITGLVCIVIVAALLVTRGGNSDGPAAFVSQDSQSAIFVQWTRTGDDVSGSLSAAHVTQPQTMPHRRASSRPPRPLGRSSSRPGRFTGTVRDDSVRLLIGSGALSNRVNGRLDGDTLELTIPEGQRAVDHAAETCQPRRLHARPSKRSASTSSSARPPPRRLAPASSAPTRPPSRVSQPRFRRR